VSYACKDRAPFMRTIAAQDGWFMDGYTRTPRMVPMPFRMAQTCQYTHSDLGGADKRCAGCTWRKS